MLDLKQIFKDTTESLTGEWESAFGPTKSAAWSKFEKNGFPVRRNEKWKYTNLKNLMNKKFEASASEVSEAPDFSKVEGLNLVFNNGHFVAENSTDILPEGCLLSTFSNLTSEKLSKSNNVSTSSGEIFKPNFNSVESSTSNERNNNRSLLPCNVHSDCTLCSYS